MQTATCLRQGVFDSKCILHNIRRACKYLLHVRLHLENRRELLQLLMPVYEEISYLHATAALQKSCDCTGTFIVAHVVEQVKQLKAATAHELRNSFARIHTAADVS